MKTTTNETKTTTAAIVYTVAYTDLPRILTAPRLIHKVATVEYLTAATVRVSFADR